ncbi:type VI secretion system Vgr family protein [Paraburkholderia bannensis]|uniref:type VI secretion system Vgr family protein n=1 Tax=Paraburkholderia bannensis TaxID=765414 RepID=UPI002AB61E0B|nr:type VI secretion system tip protein VgrG [Paraburkholderia bannensis]
MASLFDEAGTAQEFISKLTAVPGRQAYFLDVPGTESAKDLSVVEFEATEVMGAPTVLRIVATHPQQLARADYLNLDAVFTIVPDDGVPKRISGFIDRISNVKTSRDLSQYEIVLKSHFGRLAAVHTTQIYQHQATPDIIAAILLRHGIKDHQMSFRLRNRYPRHLFRFQYRVDDLAYVQMLMQKSGIYSYIVETEYGDQVVFADDIDHYLYDPRLIVPYREAAGLESSGVEAITSLKTHNFTVPQGYTVADYNPESAWERLRDSANLAPQDSTTYGQPYIYGTHHLDQAGAKWEAQLRHEAALARQVVYEGESNVLELQCARVLETDILLPDAPQGQVIVEITHSGARDKAYTNRYKAIPADRRFRLELKPDAWPKIAGTLSARICSPDKYTYGYLNSVGYYVVRFDVDFADWPKGGESVPLRLAKPFAGKLQTGMHFVALDNDEAVISFRDGDPDKPEITSFHHHSQARDLVTNDRRWLSRNMIRTQSNNKLRMEDWAGQEGIKLSTEHSGKSQLNLGYLVNQKLECRGEGFELRTSGYGAIRGGKGLFFSSIDRPGATGQQLDMQEALQHLGAAQSQMQQLAQTAEAAQAYAADAKAMNEVLQNQIKDLRQAVMLLSASASIAVVSPETIQHSAGGNLTLTAGENVDVGAMRRFTVVAGELLSFFAHKLGIKLYAKGKIDVQAQNDELALTALKNVTVTSTEGKLILTAKDEVWIGAGGSYIKINGSSIVNATAGDILEKCASWDIDGAATGTRNAALSIEQDCDVSRRSSASRHEALVPMDA